MGSRSRLSSESDAIIQEALEYYRFREKMRLFNESYERLRTHKAKWKQEVEERKELEGTLSDGNE